MVQKRALITGAGGQDGPYLTEILKRHKYEVIGLTHADLDLADARAVEESILKYQPDEIYNLAGQSSVSRSFEDSAHTHNITGLGAVRMLEATRKYRDLSGKNVKFFQPGSSEMFGNAPQPQDENTKFDPQSPYANAKVFAFNEAVRYRKEYKMFICNGILFNHESPRRPLTFVTRKITMAVSRIKAGLQKTLSVGNIDVKRDWGYAPQYMEAVYLMMQENKADDYVIGTGVAHTIRDFISEAFSVVGISDYENYILIDKSLYRASEVALTVANPAKARRVLGWQAKTSFKELVSIMVEADLKKIQK